MVRHTLKICMLLVLTQKQDSLAMTRAHVNKENVMKLCGNFYQIDIMYEVML